ncbi:uncharacterized protein LOC119179862 isoform X2 [Rhipicephalus microplus]|uniref:uncharacterized protein LOC119179862 isoform X2 n=1 Tax=Rhipicephalus microplus TaxID=6941 RepID=UPI003F6D5FC8
MKRASTAVALVLLCTATAAHPKLGAPGGPRKLHYDVPDAFEVIKAFPFSVAIMDSDNDTIFECLISNRTDIDYEAKKATFVWTIGGTKGVPKQEVPFYVTPGLTPGTMDMLIGDDPDVKQGIFYYFGHDCIVMDLEYNGHLCLLWTALYLLHNVPPVCIDQFVDTCGVVADPHRRDLCPDD